jgi:uncharacterized repeat protein (TIGR03803 family)
MLAFGGIEENMQRSILLAIAIVIAAAVTGMAGTSSAQDGATLAPPVATEAVLHSFCAKTNCADGLGPSSSLIMDKSGNFYGTTELGGANEGGTVFQLHHSASGWLETVLYSFCSLAGCTDGEQPTGNLAMDSAGNLYGTTALGGADCPLNQSETCGTVFELVKSKSGWTETMLHAFGSDANEFDGFFPVGGVVLDSSGNVYGAASQGGDPSACANGCGVVYELSPSSGGWSETILHYFALSGAVDGVFPSSGVTFDAAGNLYGTTQQCDTTCAGIAYKLAGASGWQETILHQFGTGVDGAAPMGGLVLDGSGNIYGTTYSGGTKKDGTVFKIAANGKETVLHSFTGAPDGRLPLAGLMIDSSNNLYGTTTSGGTSTACQNGCGTLFELKSTGGAEELRFSFSGTRGANPQAAPLLSGGILYGTTSTSTNTSEGGVAFSITLGGTAR